MFCQGDGGKAMQVTQVKTNKILFYNNSIMMDEYMYQHLGIKLYAYQILYSMCVLFT